MGVGVARQLSDPLTEPNVLFWKTILLGVFLANQGRFCGRGATLWCRNPLLSYSNFTLCCIMKIVWLVTDVTAVGSPWQRRTCYFGG